MRWKNSKQTRWKRLLDVFISPSWICLVICVWTEHMLYIKYQGLFVFGLERLKQSREAEAHSDLFSTAHNRSVSGTFSNRILTWYKTLWNVNTDGRWEWSGWESDLNLLLFSPNLHEMLRCHVTVFTVCWQKCNFHAKANLAEIVHRIFENRERMMCLKVCAEWCVNICVYLSFAINSRCCDTDGVFWGGFCHDQVQVGVSCMAEWCVAWSASPKTFRPTHSNVHKKVEKRKNCPNFLLILVYLKKKGLLRTIPRMISTVQ